MATSSTSYLQTLAKNEAIAFVASLQKVEAHLSQELQRLSEQVQQKTSQLQGIETLLTEAAELGLTTSSQHVNTSPTSTDLTSNVKTPATTLDDLTIAAASNGNASSNRFTTTLDAASLAPPPKRGRQGKQNAHVSTKPEAELPPVKTTSAAKDSKINRAIASKSSKSRSADSINLRQYLQTTFRDQSITDAVGEILDQTTKPLGIDELVAKLFDGLSDETNKRAKSSLANILSVGRSKGRWKSTGRGLYAGNAVKAK